MGSRKRPQPRQPHNDPRDDSILQGGGGLHGGRYSSSYGADGDGGFDHRLAEEGGNRAGTRLRFVGREEGKRLGKLQTSKDPAIYQERERRPKRLIRSRRHEEAMRTVDDESMALFQARQAHVPAPPPAPPLNPIVRLWRWFTS